MKNFTIREIQDDEHFDLGMVCERAPFTQARFYGNWQKTLGRKVRIFLISKNTKVVAYFQIIKYPLVFGKSYLYIPYGPVTQDTSLDFLKYCKQQLLRISKSENIVFVRLDFTPIIPNKVLSSLFSKAPLYTYHSAYFQPRAEWFLNLRQTEQEILMGMHEKTRYSVRLAEKKEIVTEIIAQDFEKYFDIFYELMSGTAARNGFNLHSREYYASIFSGLSTGYAYLVLASYGDRVLAIDLIIVFEKVAHYVFGGSSNEERNRMPTYSAQWKAICYAKELGCDYYNFGGIATDDAAYTGWDGLTTFKKKFGGERVLHSDFYDVVVNPFWYYLYNARKFIKKITS